MADRPPKPSGSPSLMKELYENIVQNLHAIVQSALLVDDLAERALILERCAAGFAHLNQAASARQLVRIQEAQLGR